LTRTVRREAWNTQLKRVALPFECHGFRVQPEADDTHTEAL